MIQFTKTHIGYTLPALFSIDDILLEKNSVYILVGKNGSGKSTFLRTIIKHEKILQGEIILNGKSIRWIRDNSISEHVAFVPTTFPQVDYLRVTEFVGMGRTPHTNALGRFSEKDHTIVKEALKMLNISLYAWEICLWGAPIMRNCESHRSRNENYYFGRTHCFSGLFQQNQSTEYLKANCSRNEQVHYIILTRY